MKNVYYSLFYSKLQYCIASWGGSPACNIEPIFRLQKRAIRYICSVPNLTPSHPLFAKLKMLKIHDIYKLEICKLTNKMTKFDLNGELKLINLCNHHNYRTRLTTSNNYYSTSQKTDLGKTSFNYIAPKLWRDVPTELKNLHPINLKKCYKKYLIELYNTN